MLTSRIIPCLDVRDGRVVKGVRFSNLRDAGDPAERALWYEASGGDEIVVLDVSATNESRATALETVHAVRAVLSIPVTVGGGVRSADDAASLLESGADKVAMNSAAVRDPNLIAAVATRFGRQCAVVAIDAARRGSSWIVVTHGGRTRTELDAVRWAEQVESLGCGEILLTSWDRDGTREGYDLELIAAVRKVVSVPIIASGGAASANHLAEALDAGADAVLAASIFHDGETTPVEIKKELARLGQEVRT